MVIIIALRVNNMVTTGEVKSLYQRLRDRREDMGITQEEMAEKLGFKSKNSYSLKERGLRRISIEEAIEIAKILDCPVEELFYANEVNSMVTFEAAKATGTTG